MSLDLWNEAEWIEIDCFSATVAEIGSTSDNPEHPAHIMWSDSQQRIGLPSFARTIDPAWIEGTVPVKDEGWSLVCRFDEPPNKQGNPSMAFVRFLVNKAPEHLLKRGTKLLLFERETMQFATVEILG